MSTIRCGIELSIFFENNAKQTDLNQLALWILKICYDRPNPSPVEILQVMQELQKIYTYEDIKF